MDWLVSHIDDLLAVIGGIYTAARIVVTLTPTPRDNAALARVNSTLAIVLRVVLGLAKIAGLDGRAGVRLDIPPVDPPSDSLDAPGRTPFDKLPPRGDGPWGGHPPPGPS